MPPRETRNLFSATPSHDSSSLGAGPPHADEAEPLALRDNTDTVDTTLRTGRLEAFSDGVFAIAITLLVLEISLPEDAGDDLLAAFLDQWPSYLAYLVSFATIGMTWLRHSTITHYLHGVDTMFVRLNLLLLMLVSFLPFPTGLVAEHIHDVEAERVAATILGINMLLVAGGRRRDVVPRRSGRTGPTRC